MGIFQGQDAEIAIKLFAKVTLREDFSREKPNAFMRTKTNS